MADPIRSPINRPRRFSTTKISKTARQKFQRRRKQQSHENEVWIRGRPDKQREEDAVPEGVSSKFLKMPGGKEKKKPGSRGRGDGELDSSSGKVIDIRI